MIHSNWLAGGHFPGMTIMSVGYVKAAGAGQQPLTMKELSILQTTLLITAAVLLVIKTILFIMKFKGKRIIRWIYFSQASIIRSQSPVTARHKKLQNALTFVLFMLCLVLALLLFLNKP